MPLFGGMLVAPLLASLIVYVISMQASWNPADARWSTFETVSAASACWLMGGLIGLVVLALITNHNIRKLPMGIIASSMIRAGIALFDGVAITLIFKPERFTFWGAILLGGLACLTIETLWAMRTIAQFSSNAHQPSQLPPNTSTT